MSKVESVSHSRQVCKYSDEEQIVYVLKLAVHGREAPIRYVGRSKQFHDRLKNHKQPSVKVSWVEQEKGSLKSPYEVLGVEWVEAYENLNQAQFRERQLMVELASKHGVSNVAGGM